MVAEPLRFYLPTTGTAPLSPTIDAEWDVTASGFQVRPMSTTKGTSGFYTLFANEAVSTMGGTDPCDVLVRQFVQADAFTASTPLGDKLYAAIRGYLGNNTGPLGFLQLVVKVVQSDGSLRGYLHEGATQTSATTTVGAQNEAYPLGAGQSRIWDGVPLNTVTAHAGDRIVIEVGCRFDASADTVNSWRPTFGEDGGADDLPLLSGSNPGIPWVQIGLATTVAPPCRLFPRADSLGVGSGRHFPPPKSQQRSARRFGYY